MKAWLGLVLLSGCMGSSVTTGGDAGEPADAAVPVVDAGVADAGPGDAGPVYLAVLDEHADYEALLGAMGVKYLAQVDGVPPEFPVEVPCLFQDTGLFPFHLQFLRAFPGLEAMTNQQYIAKVLRPSTRVWWGGGIQHNPGRTHPISMRNELMAYVVYADNAGGAGLDVDDIREVDARLKGCMPYAVELLAFLPSDSFQMTLANQVRDTLRAEGIAVLGP